MTSSPSRLLAVATSALAVASVVVIAPAAADPLQRIQSTVDDFSCAFATEEGPTVYVFGDSSSAGSGSAAFVEGDGVLWEGWEGTATFDEGNLVASVDLSSVPDGTPQGSVRVSARTELGVATVEQVRERSGNTWTRGTIARADYAFADVAIQVDGLTPILDEATCAGQRTVFDVRSTDPAARVYRDSRLTSEPCAIEGVADAELLISGPERHPYLEIVIGARGDDPRKAQGTLDRGSGAWQAALPLVRLVTGEQVDVLQVRADLIRTGAPARERLAQAGFAESTWVVPYEARYLVVTDDGTRLTATCPAGVVRSHVWVSPHAAG